MGERTRVDEFGSNDEIHFSAVVADRRRLVRAALATLLVHRGNIARVREAENSSELLKLVDEVQPQFILVSAELGKAAIQEAIDRTQLAAQSTRVVVLSERLATRGSVSALVSQSSHAIVNWNTSPNDLLREIDHHRSMILRHVPRRRSSGDGLTPRELEVLQLLAVGMSNREIGTELIISGGTVKRHLASIFQRLNAHSRVQAINNAAEAGYLQVPGE